MGLRVSSKVLSLTHMEVPCILMGVGRTHIGPEFKHMVFGPHRSGIQL